MNSQPETFAKNIEIYHGDLLKADAQALVNTVNCVGVMGKGIALQFARTFPENSRAYEETCRVGELFPGELLIVERHDGRGTGPRYIINFATKAHWRSPSQIEWIESGLLRLVEEIRARQISSIALPPLGCGNGGLNWADVQPLIVKAMSALPDVRVLLVPPEGAPAPETMKPAAPRRMTLANALYIHLLDRYSTIDQSFSQIELQKLAYFLQIAGEDLKLSFYQDRYGPYAPELRHVLRGWEGHWAMGYGDGTRGAHQELLLLPEAAREADEYLKNHAAPETLERVQRVFKLIAGFESALILELLATTHWIACHDPLAVQDVERATRGVRNWNNRKKTLFRPEYVELAWNQLRNTGWLSTCDNEKR